MWVKRTEAEIAEARQHQRRSRLKDAAIFGAVVFPIFLFFFTKSESPQRGTLSVPSEEILPRIPFAFVAAIVFAFVRYIWQEKPLPVVICPECEATKYKDSVSECACGGHFEDIELMKYVPEASAGSKGKGVPN
jgi:hypothetical protein